MRQSSSLGQYGIDFVPCSACPPLRCSGGHGQFQCASPAESVSSTRKARRRTIIAGEVVPTIDIHTHVFVRDAWPIVQGTNLEGRVASIMKRDVSSVPVGEGRVEHMDACGIDVAVLSANPYWYGADRALSERLIAVLNDALASFCGSFQPRFSAFAAVSLQHPELAARQLKDGVERQGLCGAAIGCSVNGDELSHPRFAPFWEMAEDLQATIFIHPQSEV